MIPAAAVSAAMNASSEMQADDLDDDAPGRSVVHVMLAAALPHLLTDEMVERAARALHEVSDDVLPFDLHLIEGMGRRRDERAQKHIDERRERYLTTARAALEAALGGTA